MDTWQTWVEDINSTVEISLKNDALAIDSPHGLAMNAAEQYFGRYRA